MNYIYLLIEVVFVLGVMILFYRFGGKNGLFTYIGFLSSLLSIIMFNSISIMSFEVSLGISFVIGIFICSNIIIQRYGMDEIKDIIKNFVCPYILTSIVLALTTLLVSSEYNITSNESFDILFGYNLSNIRIFISGLLSVGFMLWYNSYIYYYIKKNRNKYIFSYIGSMLLVQFIESIIFIFIAYVGNFDINVLFGMIAIRYLIKVIIGIIGLVPVSVILSMKY